MKWKAHSRIADVPARHRFIEVDILRLTLFPEKSGTERDRSGGFCLLGKSRRETSNHKINCRNEIYIRLFFEAKRPVFLESTFLEWRIFQILI